jgi:hypothetical protein
MDPRYLPSDHSGEQKSGVFAPPGCRAAYRHLADFYERFGLSGPERLHGMTLMIERHGPQGGSASGEAQ